MVMVAISRMLTQRPCPEQSFGQVFLWQAFPVNPAKQLQIPVTVSQIPLFEHSASACAVYEPVGTSTHALSCGHTRLEQSAALNRLTSDSAPHPSKQAHVFVEVWQIPWPLQLFCMTHPPPACPRLGAGSDASSRREAADAA